MEIYKKEVEAIEAREVAERQKLERENSELLASTQDYRSLTKLLNDNKKQYHTYALPENKTTRAVIKGVPTNISVDDVTRNLASQGLQAISFHRMISRKDKRPLPLVLVKAKKVDKRTLFQINRCCHLVVKVEHQRQQLGCGRKFFFGLN